MSLLLICTLLFIWGCSDLNEEIIIQNNEIVDSVEAASDSTTRIFIITGENFRFKMEGEDNPTLRVKEGDKIRIEFSSASGFHDFRIDEFGVATKQLKAGESEVIEFISDKSGSFEYYCSIGSHKQQGMKGKLIVE